MQQENLEDYGFEHEVKFNAEPKEPSKEETGFIGGISVKPIIDKSKGSS